MSKPPPSEDLWAPPVTVTLLGELANKVLKQVHPIKDISAAAKHILGIVACTMLDKCRRILEEHKPEEDKMSEVICTHLLPAGSELFRYAHAESTKALTKFNHTDGDGFPAGTRAGLQFPCDSFVPDVFASPRVAVVCGAATEYLLAEILELSGNSVTDGYLLRLEHVNSGVSGDAALSDLFAHLALDRAALCDWRNPRLVRQVPADGLHDRGRMQIAVPATPLRKSGFAPLSTTTQSLLNSRCPLVLGDWYPTEVAEMSDSDQEDAAPEAPSYMTAFRILDGDLTLSDGTVHNLRVEAYAPLYDEDKKFGTVLDRNTSAIIVGYMNGGAEDDSTFTVEASPEEQELNTKALQVLRLVAHLMH